ncbi:hypothetical protein [Clostridium hydrogenum]|uniref:hypothetical protein n=1 Tax=Clostridium hydrogenum TaxID=2855764 RepID=UPI001F2CF35A|nr:hypothetical protein [Clostridium hydrogenum]
MNPIKILSNATGKNKRLKENFGMGLGHVNFINASRIELVFAISMFQVYPDKLQFNTEYGVQSTTKDDFSPLALRKI